MRLHRLTVEAWGPFPGREHIDFDALADQGLFLIHGATGAGKTSILDAICYGLYASVPGARAGAKRLASDHARAGVVPQVTLDFTAAGRRLRITRTPPFARPKKSGTGYRDLPATVLLEELSNGAWLTRSTRAQEADDVVRDAVGMGREQFSTVVLLPQGEFATFLRAKPEERREVLESLFDVSRFVDVEAWLGDRRRTLGAEVATLTSSLASEWDRLGDAVSTASAMPAPRDAGSEGVPTSADSGWGPGFSLADAEGVPTSADSGWGPGFSLADPDQVRRHLGGLSAELLARAGQAHVCADAAQTAQAAALRSWEEALGLLDRQRRHADAAAEMAELARSAPEHQDLLALLDAARRAERVAPVLVGLDRAQTRLDSSRTALRRRLDDLAGAGWRAPAAKEVRAPGGPVWLSDLTCALEDMGPALAEAARLDAAAGPGAAAATAAGRAADAASARLTAVEGSISQGVAERDALVAVAAQRVVREAHLGAARSALAAAERRCRLGECRDDLVERLDAVEAEILALSRTENDAHTAFNELRSRQLAGMAGDLAARLVDGAPCPVCGGQEHPAPASPIDRVDPAEVDAAELTWARRRESTEQVRRAEAALGARLAAVRAELGPAAGAVEGLGASVAAAEGQVALAQAAAHDATQAQAGADELALSINGLRERRDVIMTALASEQALAEAALAQTAELMTSLDLIVGSHRDHCPCGSTATVIEALASDHARALASARGGLAAATECDRLGVQVDELADGARVAATAEGFTTIEDARRCVLPRDVVADLDRRARTRAVHEGALTQVLADPDLVRACGREVPDLDAVKGALDEAARTAQRAQVDSTALDRACGLVTARRAAIVGLLDSLGPRQREYAVVSELAEVVAGTGANNSRRMRLSAYVLAGRLEEIVRLANERMVRMGEGRYTLDHTDSRAARGARSGLGLVVKDAWTGQTRETSTLSGGEAFMASLALALGLGDAVRAQAGGFDLQTLFVDEGFGSLDEDSLEQVMDVLDSLREGGRAVGIVSHVGELRARVPAQVLVRKSETGSAIEVTGTPSAA